MTRSLPHPPGVAAFDPPAFVPDGHALLAEQITEALCGTGEVWLLTGERGSGRTALLDEAIARVSGPPARIVRVAADPDGEKLTLRGFVAHIAGATDSGEGAPTDDTLERAFDVLAGDEPTVLVVDGADGLAAEALRYIQFMARSAPGLQVFFVALPGFRAVLERDEFAPLRSRLGPELVVPRLSDADAVLFVRNRLGAIRTSPVQPVEDPALNALVRAGQGLPGRLLRLLDRALAHGEERGKESLTPAAVARAVHELDRPHEPYPPAEAPAAPVPPRAPARVVSDPPPMEGPTPRVKLAAPHPAPRRSVLAPVAAVLAVAGLGAWAVVATQRGAPAPPPSPPPAPQAAASAPQTTAPQTTASQTTASQTTASQTTASQTTASQTTAPQTTAPQTTAPQTTAPAPVPARPMQEAARPAPPSPPVPALTPAPDAARPTPPPRVPPDLLAALLSRGEAMLAVGDVSAARLLFERAASGGDAAALRAAGRAYDPAVLARLGAVGIRPDAARAAEYYGRAAALGDAEARRLLRQLGAGGVRR